jgi:adenosylhomocysteinase
MDMSFANQALCIEHMIKLADSLALDVHPVPEKIDTAIAKEKLVSMGIKIDRLTREQKQYLSSWNIGT